MAKRTLDFTDHRRQLDDNRHVYAVVSRRTAGLSIGLNLNTDKICNFDCPYCQVDRSTPGGPRVVDVDRLQAELDHLLGLVRDGHLWSVPPFDTAAPHMRRVTDIAWAGDGEPTSSRAFGQTVDVVGRLRAAHGLDHVALNLLTNATLLHRPDISSAMDRFTALGGVTWGKLDAGSQAAFQRVNGTHLSLDRVIDNLCLASQRWRLVLQCMFMQWQGVDPDDAEVDAWGLCIGSILAQGGTIEQVQVYSVARTPADARVGVVPVARLQQIADRARAHGLPVLVVPGVGAAG